MPKQKDTKSHEAPKELKYFLCMFTLEGHTTWRAIFSNNVENIEKQLKPPLNKTKVTAKKFFEIDRIKGTFEEF